MPTLPLLWSTLTGTAMVQQLSEPFDPLMSHPAALEKRRYALSPMQAIAVCTRRQVKLVLRDKVLLKGRMLQVRHLIRCLSLSA
jgi:hypothetical protein